jgi:ABC-type lipoprotein export system ATPase subunit
MREGDKMQITISNYNNIRNLDYEIEDSKINFLFGISGCGKSSIAKALTKKSSEDNIPYNTENIPFVEVNQGSITFNEYEMFDLDYMKRVLIEKQDGTDIYHIMIGNNGELNALKEEYNKYIESLLMQRENIFNIKGKIDTLINDLKISYTRSNDYRNGCIIKKITKNLDENKLNYLKSKNYSNKQVKWFSDGKNTDSYKNGKCPFCNKKLSDYRKSIIDKITIIDAKSFEKINAQNAIFNLLNIKEPNWMKKKEVDKFNKQIRMYYDLLPQFEILTQYINVASKTNIFLDKLEKITVTKEMRILYPEIAKEMDNFNNKYSNIRKKLGKIKSETDKLLKKNRERINDYLNILGIPYEFFETNINDDQKNAEFIIRAKNSKNTDMQKDRVNNLSYGERNLIGLIIFLISHKEDDFLIIDDPASSYDEYRRKVIFDMLYKCKGENTTMLVLSHDHIFAKYAIYHFEKSKEKRYDRLGTLEKLYYNQTGKIDYIETYNETIIKPIKKDNFDSMTNFIKERLKELPHEINYLVAINLRLYYEINKASRYHKEVYGYLSQILHRKEKSEIIESLEKVNKTENDILSAIKDDLKIDYDVLDNEYKLGINIDSMTNFEKLIFARENCSKNKLGKEIKNELNNIVHMNMAYAICLNPYEFNYFSKFVYNYLKNDLNITFN